MTDDEIIASLDLEAGLQAVLSGMVCCPESLKVCPDCGLMIGHSDICPVCND